MSSCLHAIALFRTNSYSDHLLVDEWLDFTLQYTFKWRSRVGLVYLYCFLRRKELSDIFIPEIRMILPLLNKSICRNIFPFIIFFPLFGLKAEATEISRQTKKTIPLAWMLYLSFWSSKNSLVWNKLRPICLFLVFWRKSHSSFLLLGTRDSLIYLNYHCSHFKLLGFHIDNIWKRLKNNSMLAVLLILVREKIIWLLKEIPLLPLFIVLRIGGYNLQIKTFVTFITDQFNAYFIWA